MALRVKIRSRTMLLKALIFGGGLLLSATGVFACDSNRINCIPNPVPGINVPVGTGHYNDYVPVLVCHTWWDKLWGDPSKGERWWGPTMTNRSGSWKLDLKPVKQECKWFYVRPGGSVTTEVSCFDGALATTGPITEADRGKRVYLHL